MHIYIYTSARWLPPRPECFSRTTSPRNRTQRCWTVPTLDLISHNVFIDQFQIVNSPTTPST